MLPLREILGDPKPRELRWFAGLQVPFIAVICWLQFQRGLSASVCIAVVACSFAIGCLGLWQPKWVKWVYVCWMTVLYPVGWAVSHLLMAVVFLGVVTPIAVWMRWRGNDLLERRVDSTAATYWKKRDAVADPDRYFRQS